MGACPQPSCPHHEAIDRDVQRHQKWIGDVEEKLDAHCSNGGTGHVTRYEFNELKNWFLDLRALLLKIGVVVLLASSGGSAFGPEIRSAIGKLFGG